MIKVSRRAMVGNSLLLPVAAALPARAAASDPRWQKLFDGRSLRNWQFYQEGVGSEDVRRAVSIRDGVLHFLGPDYRHDDAPPGHLSTLTEWGNYHLRLEFRYGERRWAPRKLQRRNSGVLYHMGPERDRLFPDCVELQLEEGDVGDAIMVNTLALQGPLLGGTPLWPNWIPSFPSNYQTPVVAGPYRRQWHPHAGHYERIDDWNIVDLYAFDDQAAHLVNGRIVNTLFKMVNVGKDGVQTPLTRGRIALEFEWAEVMFRNVMIRPLDAASIASIRKQGSD